MSITPDPAKDEGEHVPDNEAAAMKAQLNKEVAAWNKHRDEPSGEFAAARLTPSEAKPRRASADKKKASAAQTASQPADAPAASTASKPFAMSYDGQSQADYQRARLDRKSR